MQRQVRFRLRSGSTGFRRRFRRRFQEAFVQSQARFNGFPTEKVAEKVPEKLLGIFSAGLGQVNRFNRFNRFNRVSSAWLRSTLQKDL